MKKKLPRLKAEWVKTDIPEATKLKYHWKAMIGAPTYTAWQQNMARMTCTTAEDQPYCSRVSRDTYNQLREELLGMPEQLVRALPENLKVWLCGVRGIAMETASVNADDKKILEHDIDTFKRLDAIMSEAVLRTFLSIIEPSLEDRLPDHSMIQEFIKSYTYECDKYVSDELDNLASTLCRDLVILSMLVSPTSPDGIETIRQYNERLGRLVEVSESTGNSYTRYRAYVRKNLLI